MVKDHAGRLRSKYNAPHRISTRGLEVINDPALNKGTGFGLEERERLGLRGLVPPKVFTLDEQMESILSRVRAEDTPLAQYKILHSLWDRNETLFFKVNILIPISKKNRQTS